MQHRSTRCAGFMSSTLITFAGVVGAMISVGAIVITIGVGHYRIGQNEVSITKTVPQEWAQHHIQYPHESSVTQEQLVTAQSHIDYKIGRVEKDVARVEEIVDGIAAVNRQMDQKVDQILSEIRNR